MSIQDLNALVATFLAIAFATERFVTFLKNTIPWLADKPHTDSRPALKSAEWLRRWIVQLASAVIAWAIAGFLASTDGTWNPGGIMSFATSGSRGLPAWLVGLLASSGSALWSSVLGITSAAKDLRKQAVTSNQVALNARQYMLSEPPTFNH